MQTDFGKLRFPQPLMRGVMALNGVHGRFTVALALALFATGLLAETDWTYELSQSARKTYIGGAAPISCSKIPSLLKDNRGDDLYGVIRDAGIFQDTTCESIIQNNLDALSAQTHVANAIIFYRLKMGDKNQLLVLADIYDREASLVGDHWIVELFGYLEDWKISGRRLVRHLRYADGASGELLCSAIMWRRFLNGEVAFKANWYEYGKVEKINRGKLDNYYRQCIP